MAVDVAVLGCEESHDVYLFSDPKGFKLYYDFYFMSIN